MLEEITVTAQKRAESQQKVPVAMETISGDEIRDLGYSDISEILSNVSTVLINKAGDGLRVSIRGISDDADTRGVSSTMSNSMPTVAVNVDGVFTAGRNSGSNLYDLERVEVLFGPQSTLYASNSPGGIVNIITAHPKLDGYETSGTITIGNYDTMETQGMVNIPVNKTVALRAAFRTSYHDGYMSNGSDDDDSKSIRFRALFQPSERFSMTLTGEQTQDNSYGYSGIEMFVNQDDVDDPWDNSAVAPPLRGDKTIRNYSAHIETDFDFGVLTVIPAYSEMTETAYGIVDDVNTYMDNERTEKGAEARMASSDAFHYKWILGANYYEMEQAVGQVTIGTPYYSTSDNSIKSYSFYGNITYPVSEKFRVTGGLRYSDDTNIGIFETVGDGYSVYRPEEVTYQGLDHKIGIEYDLTLQSMLFADWTTGYRCGSMGGAEEPETLDAYTVGVKNRFFDNKLQVNWSNYYYDYKEYPASFRYYDPITGRQDPGANETGDMVMYGSDLQMDFVVTPDDLLNFSVSYEHAEFDYLYFDFESEYLEDLEYTGKALTFTPDWTINVAYSHNFNLPNGGLITARIDTRYQTAYRILWNDEYAESAGGPGGAISYHSYAGYNEQEAHHLSNFRVTYIHPDKNWSLGAYIKNLEDYAVKRSLMNGTMMIDEPRTYGVTMSLKY